MKTSTRELPRESKISNNRMNRIVSLAGHSRLCRRSVKMKDNKIDRISPEQALEILRRLARSDPKIKKRIHKETEEILKDIDVEEICEEVYSALDGIDVEELWERSGSSRHGYSGPEDNAAEMMEEELEPFNNEVLKYLEMGMAAEAKLYCMGVLKGVYQYQQESKSEFKDWAADIPGECYGHTLREWEKRSGDENDLKEMDEFIKKECSKWAK
jgi:hypothetical protein